MDDKPTNALAAAIPAAPIKAPAKSPTPAKPTPAKSQMFRLPDGSDAFKAPIGTPKAAPKPPARPTAAPTPKLNPQTARSGVPRQLGQGERQLDGTRTATFSPPKHKPGLAERLSSPNPKPGSADRTSGLERAMMAEADRLHPRRRR